MFYFEGYIEERRFDFNEVYNNLKVINDNIEDLLIYEYGNLIARVKSNEMIEFNCLKLQNIILKSNGTYIRLWLW